MVFDNLIGPLDPGESLDFNVSVTIPVNTAPGLSDKGVIKVISQGDDTKIANAMVLTSTPPNYSFELSPVEVGDSARSGETVSHMLISTNTGTADDSYAFTLHEHTWETTVTFPEYTLPPGESM